MQDHRYGRLTTLKRLDEVRNDRTKHRFTRMRADRALHKIVAQLQDRKLNMLREQLIKATKAGDQVATWKIECRIRDHEGTEREKGI